MILNKYIEKIKTKVRTMNNPKVKKGDKVLLKTQRNGQTMWLGIPLEVIQERVPDSAHIVVKSVSGCPVGQITLYYSGPADEFVLCDRKKQAEYTKEQIKELKQKIGILEEEYKFLNKYDSEEEYVAYKIDKLLRAKGIKAKAEILKELKKTNFI